MKKRRVLHQACAFSVAVMLVGVNAVPVVAADNNSSATTVATDEKAFNITVTFNYWDYAVGADGQHFLTKEMTSGDTITPPTLTVEEGYELKGWTINDKFFDATAQMSYEDIVRAAGTSEFVAIQAVIKPVEIKKTAHVAFNVDPEKGKFTDPAGAKVVTYDLDETDGDAHPIPKVEAKEGYEFTGWHVSGANEADWLPESETFYVSGLAFYEKDKNDGYVTFEATFKEKEAAVEKKDAELRVHYVDVNSDNYIKDNKVNMLGEPLPNEEKQQNIDFDTMEEFDFVFDIALAPEFKAEVSAKDKVDYYSIEVSEEMIDNQVKMYTQRTGKYDKVDAYEDNDMLKGLLAQLDEEGNTKEGGIQVEAAVLMPAYMKNDDQKAIFANAKVNDVLVFNPSVAYDGHAAELGSLLKIDKEIAKDVKSDFSFQVEEITRFVPGELTQEVFDQAFGEGVVKTEEEFRAKIKEEIAARFVADSDYKFLIDIRKVMMEKVGKLEFSDALLKRIMLLNNEEKGEEYVAENYDKSIEELTWHLIKEQLVEANDIKVEQEDVLKMARETTKAQFAQYGMLSIPDDVLDNYAQEMLKKKETINNLVSRVVEVKLAAALKAQVTLENKNVSIEEFNKMFE